MKKFVVSDKYSSTLPQTPFARPLPESRAGSPGKLTNNQKMFKTDKRTKNDQQEIDNDIHPVIEIKYQ